MNCKMYGSWMIKGIMSKNGGTYDCLLDNIGQILEEGRKRATQSVNRILVQAYWQIGNRIVEYEQRGKGRAEYGKKLLPNLSKDLKLRYGKGFSRSNLRSVSGKANGLQPLDESEQEYGKLYSKCMPYI